MYFYIDSVWKKSPRSRDKKLKAQAAAEAKKKKNRAEFLARKQRRAESCAALTIQRCIRHRYARRKWLGTIRQLHALGNRDVELTRLKAVLSRAMQADRQGDPGALQYYEEALAAALAYLKLLPQDNAMLNPILTKVLGRVKVLRDKKAAITIQRFQRGNSARAFATAYGRKRKCAARRIQHAYRECVRIRLVEARAKASAALIIQGCVRHRWARKQWLDTIRQLQAQSDRKKELASVKAQLARAMQADRQGDPNALQYYEAAVASAVAYLKLCPQDKPMLTPVLKQILRRMKVLKAHRARIAATVVLQAAVLGRQARTSYQLTKEARSKEIKFKTRDIQVARNRTSLLC